MPWSAPTRCSYPGCSQDATLRYRCNEHPRVWERSPSDHLRRALSGRRWTALSALVRREEPECRSCGRPSDETDHIVPLSDGGALWDRTNLQALCSDCHAAKTRAENAKRNRRRAVERSTRVISAVVAPMTSERSSEGRC
jgi:5-methylcytosine-specific restriction enzyme A